MLHQCCHFLAVGCLILKVVTDELLMHWNQHHSHLPLQQTVLHSDVLSWMEGVWPSQDFGYLKVASRAFWQQCPVKKKEASMNSFETMLAGKHVLTINIQANEVSHPLMT